MNKFDLVRQAAKDADVTQEKAAAVIDSAIDHTRQALLSGERVTLVNFGTFKCKIRPARKVYSAYSSKNGERHSIPERREATFEMSAQLWREMNPDQEPTGLRRPAPSKRKPKQPEPVKP